MAKLSLLHFNDVYRVQPQKISPPAPQTIDVAQFCAMLDDVRDQWSDRPDGKKDGLVLFSGDVFAPSLESSVTRGSHMVPVMNEIGPDVSLTGNHDFDFGYPHLSKLIQATHFPWVLSNIVDNVTSRVPEHLHEFEVVERAGVRIGIIGLVEKEWISTVGSWPSNFEYKDMAKVGQDLSRRLRDPTAEHKCDFIIALTHARFDIALAKQLGATSPSSQEASFADSHGVDIILGGHDHLYYISRGVNAWEGYDTNQSVLGAEEDQGDVIVVKSGTDFRDLSEISIELIDTPPGSIRRKVIKHIVGKHHTTQPGSRSAERLTKLLPELLSSVSSTFKAPVCTATIPLDVRSQYIRTAESAAGNWFADIIRHGYDDALCMKGYGGADGTFICAGVLRGDTVYGPGSVTLGDILEILPFDDSLVVLELDGEAIWDALEASLSTWPAQEGRFPVISGFRATWDSRRPPGQRVLGVWLQEEARNGNGHKDLDSGHTTPRRVDGEAISRETSGRKYRIVTREYMAQGSDGYVALKGKKYLIDDEAGQIMSTIVRKYLLGAKYVNRMIRIGNTSSHGHLNPETTGIISRERGRQDRVTSRAKMRAAENWKHLADLVIHQLRSKRHYRDNLIVSTREHMSGVDCFDGSLMRGGATSGSADEQEESFDSDLLVVHPEVDGRLKDVGRD
ncbi:hypothetical protein JAAARDRAFT_708193 [Jaapia argillacea MUCL 33604]|uniref:5'-Nucleotidase C-terminal domain-containing protein n=1 Tax=Jaapia argillacea MUCL 33604 TaxID=933084 RepID=A0A067Q0W4_9AGAM|nr:hypothetical protein JAAARDRAFT_708193 [Jaapia argillacea MUCL 33604]